MGALSMLPLSAITFSDYVVVGYMILTCLVIFDRLFPQQPSKGGRYWLARVELLKKRAVIMGDEMNSYMQTAGQLYDNGKADEALKIVHQAKMIFVDFNEEVEEVVTQARLHGVKFHGLETPLARLDVARRDINLLESMLTDEVAKTL